MPDLSQEIDEKTENFISQQKMFFVATAADEGKINLSPKGLDAFRIIDPKTVVWLNMTGSGNETAAHLLANNRMTIMMCAFEGKPNIMRIYGSAIAIYEGDKDWATYYSLFEDFTGARQIFKVSIEAVQHSCGMAVPKYEFREQRDLLNIAHDKKGREKVKSYWQEKNTTSLDGLATGQKI
jgi:hypothetical protein